jgi:PadR family transcriptional regulator, regulatory protein PadR
VTEDTMSKPSFLGEFEQMILLAVLRLRNDAPGILIREESMSQAGRRVSRGAMYTTLERLLAKGYVTWTLGDPTAERGGRAKRHFAVTYKGRDALRLSGRALFTLWTGQESILKEGWAIAGRLLAAVLRDPRVREDVLGDLHAAYQKYERQSRVPGLRYWIALATTRHRLNKLMDMM